MSTSGGDAAAFEAILKKPNRTQIVVKIGARGGASFKELKSDLGIGVGTLYYHLDGLAQYVTQNGSRQYVLTDLGKQAYEYLKTAKPAAPVRKRPVRLLNALREALFFESYVERNGTEATSNIGLMVGVVIFACLLASAFKLEPTILILRLGVVTSTGALVGALLSWSAVLLAVFVVVDILFKAGVGPLSLATSVSFSFVPMLLLMAVTGFRKVFALGSLDGLYSAQVYPLIAVGFGIWAAYILTISLRSAARFSIERSLVVTLTVLLINIGYLWLFPVLRI